MTEPFQNIADETCPSFMESLMSDSSRILDNVSLFSNPGLPVAASTVARSKEGFIRHPDVQASYLEERTTLSSSESDPKSVLESRTEEKCAIILQDDREESMFGSHRIPAVPQNAYIKESNLTCSWPNDNFDRPSISSQSQDTSFGILPLERMKDLSIGLCTLPLPNKGEKVENVSPCKWLSDDVRRAACDNNASLSSLLDNEKLLSIADLNECSTDDDVEDDELYDNHLENYFERLVPPGMYREEIEGQELPEPPSGSHQDNFQMLCLRVEATGMESDPASDDEVGENPLEQVQQPILRNLCSNSPRLLVAEDYRNSSRPRLEGGNSDEDSKFRKSAEGQVITSSQTVGSDVGGEGNHGSEDDRRVSVLHSFFTNARESRLSKSGLIERNVAGEENENLIQPLIQEITDHTYRNDTTGGQKIDSFYLQPVDDKEVDFSMSDSHYIQMLKSAKKQFYFKDKECEQNFKSEENDQQNTLNEDNAELGLSDAYLSPTSGRRTVEYKSVSTPHSIVYQNEKGKWVTDLAYYTPFENENANEASTVEMNLSDADFKPASSAIRMIEDDQKEFEKEHRFIQEEVMDIADITLGLGDTSWKLNSNYPHLRASHVSHELESDDARYRRLSLGEFFGQRSEALGCLEGNFDGKRPSFGYYIRSPEKQDPIVLLRSSCASLGFTDCEDVIKFCDDTLTEEMEKKKPNSTFTVGKVDSAVEKDTPISSTQTGSSQIHKEQQSRKYVDSSNQSDSPLSISTIASAIANASSSADPSQLAAMIMALSNKNRHKPRAPKQDTGMASKDTVWYSSLNTGCISLLDVEKYIKEVDLSDAESMRSDMSVADLPWDMRLAKAPAKTPHEDLLTSTIKMTKAGSLSLLGLNESPIEKKGSLVNANTLPKNREKPNKSSLLRDSDGKTTCECSFPKPKSSAQKHDVENHSTEKSVGITTSVQGKLLDSDTKYNVEELEMDDRMSPSHNSKSVGSLVSGQSNVTISTTDIKRENHQTVNRNIQSASFDQPHTAPFKNMKPTNKSILYKSNEDQVTESVHSVAVSKAAAAGTYKNKEKNVNFEHAVSSTKNVDLKSKLPHPAGNHSEDEHYSFRPSTSPLIHSSPSQDSLTPILSGFYDSPTLTKTSVARVPSADSFSSESLSSSVSMSRLTYVSSSDNTLQNTMLMHTPEATMSNNTFQLSTTIIRASPTPSEEYAAKDTENVSFQRNEERTSLNASIRKTLTKPGLQSKNVNDRDEINKSSSKMKLESDIQGIAPKEKIDCVNSVSPSKSSLPYNSKQVNVNVPLIAPESTMKGSPTSQLAPSCILSANSLCTKVQDNPYVPISTFKPAAAYNDVYSVHNTALPLCTLSAQLSQQYLGSEPASANIDLPQFPLGVSAAYGLPARFLDSASQAGYIQNCVRAGTFGANVGAGLLTSLSPLPTTGGFANWQTQRSSGLEHVKVPDEIRFPNACCVGIASQTCLSVFNPTGGWLYVSLGTLSVSVNGEKIDTLASQCLIFEKNKAIGPRAASDIKILFVPLRPGIFQYVLSVSSWPVNTNGTPPLQSDVLATKVILTAFAENPSIEVDAGKTGCLDFGDLPLGSWKALPLKLINKTQVTVPIRLVISANAVAWPCFAFSKEPVNSAMLKQTDRAIHLVFSSVLSHVMHASYDGQDSEIVVVWVIFRAPPPKPEFADQKITSEPLGKAEEFLARVDVELESTGPSCVMKSIPLRAQAGTPRIHAPQDLQTVYLCAQIGSTAKQFLPLKNAGNISVELNIKCAEKDSDFSVEPNDLFLTPWTEQAVEVLFTPQNLNTKSKSVLIIYVKPSGPQYEVMLEGSTENASTKTTEPSSVSPHVPPILSNKQFMMWGGVTLGSSILQKLILRNNSSSLTQNLRLVIKGQDQDCFQLHNTYGAAERLTHYREISIQPSADREICVMFTPSRVSCMLAKLEIKHSGIRPSQPGIKFTTPLSGYGGTSNIILENVRKLSDSYVLLLNGISNGKMSKATFSLRNTGSRAAYIKAVCFMNIQTRTIMDPKVISVSPERFVLLERTQQMVTVTCYSTPRELNLCSKSTALLSTICFLCGDEVMRQQYRRILSLKPDAVRKSLPGNSLLKNMNFDEEYQNEKLVKEVFDLPQRLNDIQLFYGTMKRIILSLVGNTTTDNPNESPPCSQESLDSDSVSRSPERSNANTSLDVLPVKGPQGPPLCLPVTEQVQQAVDSEVEWTVYPDTLNLNAHVAGNVKIINNSTRALKFELSWPAHSLTITPQHGIVDPKSSIQIFVSPNPSLAANPSVLPWRGHIYVLCNNGQKLIKVQIRESTALARAVPSSQPKTPVVHMAKPFSKLTSTCVEAKDQTIMFPKTLSGSTSDSYLDIRNSKNGDVRWSFSFSEPPYVKKSSVSGDVYRTNYSVFRCPHIYGVLEAGETSKIPVSFSPQESGEYTQYWEMESHPLAEPQSKHRLRFHLCGKAVNTDYELASDSSESEDLIKPRRMSSSDASSRKTGSDEFVTRGVYTPINLYKFPPTPVGECKTLKVSFKNTDVTAHMLTFVSPKLPFWLKHSQFCLRPHHYMNLPVQFKPKSSGKFEGAIVAHTEKCGSLRIQLIGEAFNT
ncbi:centrosomal protein of 192 kDa [Lissotriton helveticus]